MGVSILLILIQYIITPNQNPILKFKPVLNTKKKKHIYFDSGTTFMH